MRKIVTLGILVLLAMLAMPTASANVTMYFVDQDSSVPNGCGNNTTVEIWVDVTAPHTLRGGQIAVNTNATCVNITDLVWDSSINQGNSDWKYGQDAHPCGAAGYDWVVFDFTTARPAGTTTRICNLTVNCNCSPPGGYCISQMNFTLGAVPGSCPIQIVDYPATNIYPANVTLVNGTVTCGVDKADLVPNRIDSKYIFADLNNSLFADVTNQGGLDSGAFDVRTVVTASGVERYNNSEHFDSLAPGASTCLSCADCKSKGFLGWWQPTAVENITITVTVDCNSSTGNSDVDEGAGEGNNVLVDIRNTTNDCSVDTMLPDTCYGYRGDNPMTTAYEGTGGVIYSVGDFKYKNNTVNFNIGASGDDNQIDGLTAKVPAGATIKNATLYVYYCYRKVASGPNPGADPTPDYNMSINGGDRLTDVEYYTDIKGFAASESQYGTLVYNVTANVTGNGTYQAVRSNCSNTDPILKKKGYVSGMALMIIYACDDPCDEYRIAHGYDRLATLYFYTGSYRPQRMEYYVDKENATTTATLTDIDPNVTANLFTVAIDAVPPAGESQQFNAGGTWDVGAWDCIINPPSGCNYYHPLGINRAVDVDITPSGTDETVSFREEWTCASNGFAPLFMCLTTHEENKSVHTAPNATEQCYVTFSVDKGCIKNLTAHNATAEQLANFTLDHGLFSFNITCLEPGETVNVTIESCAPVNGYMKYNKTLGDWDDKVPYFRKTDTIGVITLKDGGHYDTDSTPGQIGDPVGPLAAAVDVSIDPCPVDIYVGIPKTVNISLSNIEDYGSGTIHLYYDKDMLKPTSVGNGDSNYTTTCPVDINSCNGYMEISAHNDAGLDGTVAFANVTFVTAPGATSGCTYLNLTVETLYDRNYTALPTVVNNCTDVCIVETNRPYIVPCPTANPDKILNDTNPWRARVQYTNCTNITNLTVQVTDDTNVAAVYVNLTSILGATANEVPMDGPLGGAVSGTWYLETNASYSSPIPSAWDPTPHILKVMAVDEHGNWNNDSNFELTVLRRGDVSGSAIGSEMPPDNIVDDADYYFIAKYTVGLVPPDAMDKHDRRCRGEIVGLNGAADSWNGIDMADALYIAMYCVDKGPLP